MFWEEIIGQDEIVEQLKETIRTENISHAYLFSGPRGVGKKTVAKVFASAINCAQKGCGRCSLCVRIKKEVHPDIFFIEPEGNYLTLEQEKELQHEVNLRSFEAKFRVFIINEAHCLTEEAGNALLKILEEPPENVIFILITSNPDELLPTIRSRCQLVRFKLISLSKIIQVLKEKCEVDEDKAELIAKVSKGILSTALDLVKADWRWERRKVVLEITQKISKADFIALEKFVKIFLDETKKPLRQIEKDQNSYMKQAKELAVSKGHASYIERKLKSKHKRILSREERQGLEEILDILSSWYRDLFIVKESKERSLLTNFDYIEEVAEISNNLSFQNTIRAMDEIEKTKGLLRFNINTQLALEGLLLKLGGLASAYGNRSSV